MVQQAAFLSIPAAHGLRNFAEVGELLSDAVSLVELYRCSARQASIGVAFSRASRTRTYQYAVDQA